MFQNKTDILLFLLYLQQTILKKLQVKRQTQRLYTYLRVQRVQAKVYKQKPTKTKGISKGKDKPNAHTLTQESRKPRESRPRPQRKTHKKKKELAKEKTNPTPIHLPKSPECPWRSIQAKTYKNKRNS